MDPSSLKAPQKALVPYPLCAGLAIMRYIPRIQGMGAFMVGDIRRHEHSVVPTRDHVALHLGYLLSS